MNEFTLKYKIKGTDRWKIRHPRFKQSSEREALDAIQEMIDQSPNAELVFLIEELYPTL